MELGNKIKYYRLKKEMTQERLAEKLGLSAQAVSKWELGAAMPDITLLPQLAEEFGVSIDELFDLTGEQKLRRIENRLEYELDWPADAFWEAEEFLKNQLGGPLDQERVNGNLGDLYHNRMMADAKRVSKYARTAIRLAPNKKAWQWLLDMAEGHMLWDWNCANHSKAVDFYKELVEAHPDQRLSYLYLLDNLIADNRADEAEDVLARYRQLPDARPVLIRTYEAWIALARYDRPAADAIMEQALKEFPNDGAMLFEMAQYCARQCRYDEAIRYYEASYAAEEGQGEPRFADALQAIAQIHEIRGQYAEAAATQDRFIRNLIEEWGITEGFTLDEAKEEKERLLSLAK